MMNKPMRCFALAFAVLIVAVPARAADVFTMAANTDRFASLHLQVKVTAPDRAAYLQEGTQYKVDPNWQYVDSILCDWQLCVDEPKAVLDG